MDRLFLIDEKHLENMRAGREGWNEKCARDISSERGLIEVIKERAHQDTKWGGPDHDDKHSYMDWVTLITDRADELSETGEPHLLAQIAALACAAINWISRGHLGGI